MASVREHFGDCRWWERPRCFGSEQSAQLVSNLDQVKAELLDLYPADVCRHLLESGHGWLVLGLFMDDAFFDHIGEVLLLGEDLRLCQGWRDEPGLIACLRDPLRFAPARFEVGVWAGLRRAGLAPLHSDGKGSSPAADFEFEDGNFRVAIELKYVASSDRDRNYGVVENAVSFACRPSRRDVPHKLTIALAPQILQDIEDLDVDRFREQHETAVHRAVIDFYRQADGRVPFGPISAPPLGDASATALPPETDPQLILQTSIEGYEEDSLEHEVRRALRPLRKKAARQLMTSSADVRVAVVWTGRSNVPIRESRAVLASFVAHDPDSYGAIDFIAALNAHRLGPQPGWTTEAVVYRCPWARHDLGGMRWPGALVDWKYQPF